LSRFRETRWPTLCWRSCLGSGAAGESAAGLTCFSGPHSVSAALSTRRVRTRWLGRAKLVRGAASEA